MPRININALDQIKESVFEYKWKDVVLYALGIGTQPDELPFLYEGTPGGVKVFPSYAVIAGGGAAPLEKLGRIDFSRFIHGEQYIKLYQPFSPQGRIIRKGKITHIYDKGKNAVIHSLRQGFTEKGEHIFDAKWVHVYLDAGGFGGESSPKSESLNPPEGVEPDFSISYKTNENQAALYRLNGDYNPLHIDPEFASRSGRFKGPILHGLCTYGFVTRAIFYGACNGEISRFKEFSARFSSPVYPGDKITTEGWKDNNRYIIQARTEQKIVINNSYALIE
ncbi:MAG: MaoC/PaaZ C-terminal domain-containing protein [Promethearchaeota archaeon]